MPEKLFTSRDAARFLQISERTLARWREQRCGPGWVKIGRLARYRPSELQAYLDRNTHQPVRESA